MKSELLGKLNDEQIAAVTHGEGPLLIVAGAGTGKTTVITRRIAYFIEQKIAEPQEILALAFGEKAAEEMEERVDKLLPYGYYNLQISTFHSFCEQILKEHGLEIGLPEFQVLNETGQWLLLRQNLEKFDLDYYRPLGNPTRFLKALVSHFARAKDELAGPADYLAFAEKLRLSEGSGESGENLLAEEARRVAEVANAYHVYQRLLLQNNRLDFGDLINYTLELFQKRPMVLAHYRDRFKYILIDEFQDTNYAQYELLKLLAAPRNNLTVVGDDDQSIFKFRGASISNILHFQKDYPAAKFVTLVENYRSGQKILDLAYDFIRQNDPDRLEVRLGIQKKLKANTPGSGYIETVQTDNYLEEAEVVVEKITAAVNADPLLTWNDFAILARSHDALEPFLSRLEQAQIPYIYFANRGLYRKKIILDLLAYFRLLDNYHESQALYRVLRLPVFGISPAAVVELGHYSRKKATSLFEAVKDTGAIVAIDEQSRAGIKKLLTLIEKHSRIASEKSVVEVYVQVFGDLKFDMEVKSAKFIEAFSRKIQNFLVESEEKTLQAFMRQIVFELEAGEQGELDFDPEAGPDAVKLMTVHGAKGLEFQNVFVVSLVDKRFPTIERREQIELPAELIKDILPTGNIHLEEERRLFYVAMTRARQTLYLTRANDYGGKRAKKPSRFLFELDLAREKTVVPTGVVRLTPSNKSKVYILPVPEKFSFSQISLFRSCPLEYKYRYILNLPVAGSASLSFGSTIHKALELYLKRYQQMQGAQDLFRQNKQNKLPPLTELLKFYETSWIDEWYDSKTQKAEYRALGKKILEDFFEWSKSHLPRPKYLEAFFKLKLGGAWFVGKIDRVDEGADGVLIIDYKTGQARSRLSPVDKQQLLIYQWAMQDFFREKVAGLQYWYLQDKLEAETFLGEEREIVALKERLANDIAGIRQAAQDDGFNELDRRLSHECEYRDLEK